PTLLRGIAAVAEPEAGLVRGMPVRETDFLTPTQRHSPNAAGVIRSTRAPAAPSALRISLRYPHGAAGRYPFIWRPSLWEGSDDELEPPPSASPPPTRPTPARPPGRVAEPRDPGVTHHAGQRAGAERALRRLPLRGQHARDDPDPRQRQPDQLRQPVQL